MYDTYRFILAELRSAWRFRWLAMGCAWLLCIAGWLVVMLSPNIYEANARVYVDASSELNRLLGDQIVEQTVTTELNFVRQAILGRAELERVVTASGLDSELDSPEARQVMIARLQQEIVISSTPTGSGTPGGGAPDDKIGRASCRERV